MLTLLALLALTGCEFANGPSDGATDTAGGDPSSDTGSGGCPAGLSPAATASLQVTQLLVDGETVSVDWDGSATWNGQSGACVDAAGTEAQYVLTVDGVGSGLLTVFASEVGSVDLSSGGSLRIQLTGSALGGDSLDESSWEAASILEVDNVGSSLDWSVTNATTTGASGSAISLEANGSATASF
jgi:hypothetical protein